MNIILGSCFKGVTSFLANERGLPHYQVDNRDGGKGNRRTLVSDYQDRVSLSVSGKQFKLHIKGEGKDTADKAGRSWERIVKEGGDKVLKLMDKHISIAGNILERMKKLTEAAQDETLSDIDRIYLQIEVGRLQHDLDYNNDLMEKIYLDQFKPGSEAIVSAWHGVYEDSYVYKMLERTRERIANGEEWDVAEVATGIFEIGNDMPRSEFALPSIPDKVLVGSEWQISDDETVPTVGEILKAKGRSVMDADAAVFSTDELEKSLTTLAEKRQQLISFVDRNGESPKGLEAADYFQKTVSFLFQGVDSFMQSLFRVTIQNTLGPDKDEQGNLAPAPALIPQVPFDEEDAAEHQIKYTHSPVPYEEFSLYA
jgi:hypothetical protein